jgi:flagellar motor switch protein FliM
MADEILSSEELDALLSSVDESASGNGRREKRVLEYDFVRPNKLSGEQLRSLQRLHEAIAQSATMALSTYLRINLEVNIVSLGELTFEVFRNSLPNPTVINVLSLDPLPERALATMDMKLAFSLLDRMLGGPGKPLDKVRALTTIEQSLLDNVIKRFLEQLANGWSELTRFTPVVEAREMDPQFVQVIPSSEMVLVSTFAISAPGELEPGELCFCVPFISLDGILSRLSNQFRFASMHREQTSDQATYLKRVVTDSTLTLQTVLGQTTLCLDEIMNLKVGDVMVLDERTNSATKGFIKDQLRIIGRPGKLGRKAALLVDRVVPDGRER